MSKELAKQTPGQLAHTDLVQHQTVLRTDMPIPRIYLMQKMSERVENETARVGEFIRSTTEEKIGDSKSPIDIIPLMMSHGWSVEELPPQGQQGRSKWVRNEPRTRNNEELPWTFVENGRDHKRVKTLSLFALLPKDIDVCLKAKAKMRETGELPDDPSSMQVLPVVITFRSTSMKAAGAKISNFFSQVIEMTKDFPGAAPYQYSLSLSNVTQKNEKGSFQVNDLGPAKKLPKDSPYLAEAANWFGFLTTKFDELKIDAEDTEVDSNPTPEVHTAAAHKKPSGKQQF